MNLQGPTADARKGGEGAVGPSDRDGDVALLAGGETQAIRSNQHRIRRLPILSKDGALVGIVTHDDLVRHIGLSTGELGDAIAMPPAKPRRV